MIKNADSTSHNKLLSAQIRAVGEHYVMARLLSQGLIVGMAPENTKAIDLIATSGDGARNLQIQVKTRTKGKSSDEGWHMQEKHEHIVQDNLYYVFVALPKKWVDSDQPDTFIIPSGKVAQVLKKVIAIGFTRPAQKVKSATIPK